MSEKNDMQLEGVVRKLFELTIEMEVAGIEWHSPVDQAVDGVRRALEQKYGIALVDELWKRAMLSEPQPTQQGVFNGHK